MCALCAQALAAKGTGDGRKLYVELMASSVAGSEQVVDSMCHIKTECPGGVLLLACLMKC